MRNAQTALIALALTCLAGPAFAQAAATPYNISWAALDPGNDWAAEVIRSIFPVTGTGAGTGSPIGAEASVIQLIVGQFTGFIAAIAAAFVAYNVIMNIHRAAESSRILGSGQSWMFVVRVGFAGIMMFPLAGGFSAGQSLVMRGALLGVGMAKVVYANAIQAIGPDAIVIAQPMIPGTKKIVAGLIDNELCKDLVNLATNTGPGGQGPALIPTPAPITSTDPSGDGFISWQYEMSAGNNIGTPICGVVTIRKPGANVVNVGGVDVDMAGVQQAALSDVLSNDIQQQVAGVAQQLWQTKQSSSLVPLQAVFTNATRAYTGLLTTEATNVTQAINASMAAHAQQYRQGADTMNNFVQAGNLGFSGAGAYYLEIAKMNATTLSLLENTPEVTPPTYQGVGTALSYDLAPLAAVAKDFMGTLNYVVQTTDSSAVACGTPQQIDGGNQASGPVLTQVLCNMNIDDGLLVNIANWLLPASQVWTDPFGGLMSLGMTLINTSLLAMGAAALISSAVVAGGSALFNILTFNWGGAAASVAGNAIMSFLGTPIFFLLLAILVPGITIAYVLPMIPWVMWMAGVAGWIILVCEAMIAVPLWMLAHMTFGGDGLHGRASKGWSLLFSVVFRPVLMLIGLFLGYFVFDCMSWLIRESFGVAAGFVLNKNAWIVPNFIGMVVLLGIFVSTHVVAALMSFRLVAMLPHHLPRLIGFGSAGRVDTDDFANRGGMVAGAAIGGGLTKAIRSGAAGYSNSMKTLQNSRQRSISSPGEPPDGDAPMDTTLRATTDASPGDGGSDE